MFTARSLVYSTFGGDGGAAGEIGSLTATSPPWKVYRQGTTFLNHTLGRTSILFAPRSAVRAVIRTVLVITVLILPAGCDDLLESASAVRDRLTFAQLAGDEDVGEGPVDNAYFLPVGTHSEALHELTGVLEVPVRNRAAIGGGFPAFKVAFFTDNGHLVPVRRDIIDGKNVRWDIILSPGRVWSEETDDGWSRGSFPFTLVGRVWNQSHNGIATFLFNEGEVSDLVVQIVQEAASWEQFDGWARMPMTYRPQAVGGLEALRADYQRELSERMPIREWHELESDEATVTAGEYDGTAVNVSISGLVIDGAFYGQPCRTRFGDYPYCPQMRHGVYSVTKSVGAALSLFWLAQAFGDEVYDELIADHLTVTASHDGWDEVTFRHALDMMTGVGELAPDSDTDRYVFEADDEGDRLDSFAAARDARSKLRVAFGSDNYAWGPGEVGRYNTIHTFVLAAAMDAYLKSRRGPEANLWDEVTKHVLRPIGIAHAPMMHTREADGQRGIPIMGYGYLPTVGELAKIAQLFHNRGAHEGRQLIDADAVGEILDHPQSASYPIPWDNESGRYRYGRSFWFMPFEAQDECFHLVPQMLGYGGNVVQLLPNGMTAIRLSDGPDEADGNSDGEPMARIAHRLRPFCD